MDEQLCSILLKLKTHVEGACSKQYIRNTAIIAHTPLQTRQGERRDSIWFISDVKMRKQARGTMRLPFYRCNHICWCIAFGINNSTCPSRQEDIIQNKLIYNLHL